jgi:hypothetical protein
MYDEDCYYGAAKDSPYYCGKVVKFNSSAPAGGPPAVSGETFFTVWEGLCEENTCRMCVEGQPDSECGSNRLCMKGKWIRRIYVDQSIKTFNYVSGGVCTAQK